MRCFHSHILLLVFSSADYVSPRGCGSVLELFPDEFVRAFCEGHSGISSGNFYAVISLEKDVECEGRSDLLWSRVNKVNIAESLLWSVEMFVIGIE